MTYVKLVPPFFSSVFLARCVTTKTGAWNGGSSPHGTSPPSAIRRPITYAPADSNVSSMILELTLRSPPAKPRRSRQAIAPITQRVILKNPRASGLLIQSLGSADLTFAYLGPA